ncbi:transposase [Cucumis melo var. makuwa]|uniref:Transposase n=1 Tax=Cucumis melo var. makuwa TaxID=1194695 RepID=A0A5A7UVE2_CUCMM|nr:transposase [Cucumis melo var. makuwa]
MQVSSSKDKNPNIGDMSLYGNTGGVWIDELVYVLADLNRVGHKSDSFILASQAKQVFYVKDPSDVRWSVVLTPPQRDFEDRYNDDELGDTILQCEGIPNDMPNVNLNNDLDDSISTHLPPPSLIFFFFSVQRRPAATVLRRPHLQPPHVEAPHRRRPILVYTSHPSPHFNLLSVHCPMSPVAAAVHPSSACQICLYWNVRGVTLEFLGFTAGLVEDSPPLLGWIHVDVGLNKDFSNISVIMMGCAVD